MSASVLQVLRPGSFRSSCPTFAGRCLWCRARAALHALESVVNILASGKGPRSLSMHFAGASLVALAKENGDVRPIAVGEVLRRLTSKCLCSAVRSDAQRFFGSLQVACPLGLEAAIHTISQYCERNAASTSKIVMTIDFHNAFNSLDRNALLVGVISQHSQHGPLGVTVFRLGFCTMNGW